MRAERPRQVCHGDLQISTRDRIHEYIAELPATITEDRRASKHRVCGLSHIRQCGHDVLRMLAGPLVRGGGVIPHRIVTISVTVTVSCCV